MNLDKFIMTKVATTLMNGDSCYEQVISLTINQIH